MQEVCEDVDVCIGQVSTTSVEWLTMGLSVISIITAQNQIGLANALRHEVDRGTNEILDFVHGWDSVALTKAINMLSGMRPVFEKIKSSLDGNGSKRIVNRLILEKSMPANLLDKIFMKTPAALDARAIFKWQKEPEARKYFHNKSSPSIKEHFEWFRSIISDEDNFFRIIEYEGLSAGFVNCKILGDELTVSVLISRSFRRKGLAQYALKMVCEIFSAKVIKAVIHKGNEASKEVFKRVGFCEISKFDSEFSVFKWEK